MRISPEQLETIRYEVHQPELVAAMQRVDRQRFRSLGLARTEAFVRHGWETAQRLRLLYVNDAGYILFLMTFLGSYFLEDFRHAEIARILREPDPAEAPGFDTRIRRARTAFIAYGDQRIGPNATIYLADLRRFAAWLDTTNTVAPHAVLEALLRCHGGAEMNLSEAQQAALLAEAKASATALGLDREQGDALALSLRWWLGFRFEEDPLYPWVRDVAGRERDAKTRTEALRKFALRRLSTLRKG